MEIIDDLANVSLCCFIISHRANDRSSQGIVLFFHEVYSVNFMSRIFRSSESGLSLHCIFYVACKRTITLDAIRFNEVVSLEDYKSF